MESARYREQSYHKFTWTINNFLLYGYRFDGELYSPTYAVRIGGSVTVWRLHDNILHTVLERLNDNGPDKVSMYLEMSCVKTDGTVESLYFSGKKDFVKTSVHEVISPNKWTEILKDNKRSQYFQNGSITIQVLMRTCLSHIHQHVEESLVTQIAIKRIVCQQRIENFSSLPFDKPMLCSPPHRNDFKILLKRTKNSDSISVDLRRKTYHSDFYSCLFPRYNFKLLVLDSKGISLNNIYEKCKLVQSTEDFFYNFSNFIGMDELKCQTIQPGDALNLQFEFTFETGDAEVLKSMIAIKNTQPHSVIQGTEAPKPVANALSHDLRAVYSNKTFTDIQLKAGEDIFSAHKVILSGRSPVFAVMFLGEFAEKKSPIVHIDDLDAITLDKLLLYMYTEIMDELEEETAMNLLYAADKYQVLPLKGKCTSYLRSIFSSKNVYRMLEFANLHQEELLKKNALEFIYSHHRSILSSEEWKQFISKHVVLASEIICELSTRYSLSPGIEADFC